MNALKHIITSLFFAVPLLAFGQIYDKDSIFILERKSLEFGKAITGKAKNDLTGFTWRVGAGYFSQSGNAEFYNNPAAVASLALDFGYRIQFIEAGYRHLRTGFALGSDHPYYPSFGGANIIASYSLPALTGLVSNLGTATLHIPIKKVPVFINIGIGRSVFRFSDKFIRQEFYEDGTSAYIHTRTAFGTPSKITAFTSMYGLGFAKGPFIAGIEWYNLRGEKDGFGNRYSNNFQNMYLGVQMNTNQKRKNSYTKKTETFNRRRVALGINKMVTIAPFKRNSGTGTGWSADASVSIGRRSTIHGSFQFNSNAQGYTKEIPENGVIKWQDGTNPAGGIGRHLLYAGSSLTPRNAFQIFTYYGAGYYFLTADDESFIVDPFPVNNVVPINFKRSGGIVMGTGFQYKYIHSQILLHKSFRSIPAILEWNLGGRMLF